MTFRHTNQNVVDDASLSDKLSVDKLVDPVVVANPVQNLTVHEIKSIKELKEEVSSTVISIVFHRLMIIASK